MRADRSGQLVTPGSGPEGLELRRYDDSPSGPMLAAHNAAFVDHPNFTPWAETMWKQWVTESRSFRPGLSFVLVDPARSGEVAAYVQTNEYDALEQTTGRREAYVAKGGTRGSTADEAWPPRCSRMRCSSTATPASTRPRSTRIPRTRPAFSASTSGPGSRW